jgi:hypothetical protein
VNAARRGELYSKYTYYHSYYTAKDDEIAAPASDALGLADPLREERRVAAMAHQESTSGGPRNVPPADGESPE